MPVNHLSEGPHGLDRCLRHERERNREALSKNNLDQPRLGPRMPRMPRIHLPRRDMSSMSVSSIWHARWKNAIANLVHLLWVAVIYLASELIIWGLSRTLHPVGLEFFASILGMLLVFSLSTAAYFIWQRTDYVLQNWIKEKVDFINTNLGLGFPVPVIMLNQDHVLGGHDIACIIGAFITTNLVSWISVFLLSMVTLSGAAKFILGSFDRKPSPRSPSPTPYTTEIRPSNISKNTLVQEDNRSDVMLPDSEQQTLSSSREPSCERTPRGSTVWKFLAKNYPIILSLSSVFIIGVPVAVAAHDERFVDAFSLWFIWISSVSAQRSFKHSRALANRPHSKRTLATIMNPVLLTILFMIVYTRLKAVAFGKDGLLHVLKTFSGGTPLYALWTASVTGTTLPGNPTGWFGAGDAALSILECGILTWGFKLSECRRQIFSIAGLVTIFLCIAAAAGNVFLSVLMGRAMGLQTPEALSFAARSTTLALAKPAMEAIGGNSVVNATLVVSNGILGQLMYPFALGMLGVVGEETSVSTSSRDTSCETLVPTEDKQPQSSCEHGDCDSPVTIATGIAIGINGAAMGVSYLYEAKSRAAPYAALAMTVFGVMTVIFTTMEPFRGVVVSLASH
ncbi:hypothetical protein PT974_08026 [Cladobotryum mycophilum]|uniref:LrgB-like protein n=1 Tax=Cladobotryum mycophilum TaxID=491253 RepID=A0ABR0SDN0_9HYPO